MSPDSGTARLSADRAGHSAYVRVLIDDDGRPACSKMWPGNNADVTALLPVVGRSRERFAVDRLCIVADCGMISVETIAAFKRCGLLYVLGVRERANRLVECAPGKRAMCRPGVCASATASRREHPSMRPVDSRRRHSICAGYLAHYGLRQIHVRSRRSRPTLQHDCTLTLPHWRA